MRVGNFDCAEGSESRDDDRAVYGLLHMAWYYIMPPDPRTGERAPLVPLGASARTLEDANVLNAFFKEHNEDDGEDFTEYGFLGTAPHDKAFTVAWPESVWEMLKRYVEAWIGVKGHARFSEFYQTVHKKLKSFEEIKDSKWNEMEKETKDAASKGAGEKGDVRQSD